MIPQLNHEPELNLSENVVDDNKTQHQNEEQMERQPWLIRFDDSMTSSSSDDDEDPDGNNWYTRSNTALANPRALRKIIIPQARVGLDMVNSLQASAASKKKVDVTGKRRERKSVLPQHVWGQVEQQLQLEGIHLVSRENEGTPEDRTRATLTYYGTSAVFFNHQVRTKIRMRIRYYLSYVRQPDGSIVDVQRAGVTKDKGFLELKVKSPRAFEENSVDKYRLLVSDESIAQLVNLDATHPTFRNDLDLIKQAIQKENADKAATIDVMFGVICKLALRKSAFIRPSLVVSYERAAYKYIEKDYPIPVKTTSNSNKKRSLSEVHKSKTSKKRPNLATVFQWRRRRAGRSNVPWNSTKQDQTESDTSAEAHHDELVALKPDGIFYEPSLEEIEDPNVEHHDIEYQFTIDRNIRAHYPLLPVPGAIQMPVAEHFDVVNRTELMRYPADARVVEFKEPLVVAELPKKDRSDDHNTLINVVVETMKKEILFNDYDENVGKYGVFRSRLMQEHKTNRIKNELIEIDFSGTGKYIASHLVSV